MVIAALPTQQQMASQAAWPRLIEWWSDEPRERRGKRASNTRSYLQSGPVLSGKRRAADGTRRRLRRLIAAHVRCAPFSGSPTTPSTSELAGRVFGVPDLPIEAARSALAQR